MPCMTYVWHYRLSQNELQIDKLHWPNRLFPSERQIFPWTSIVDGNGLTLAWKIVLFINRNMKKEAYGSHESCHTSRQSNGNSQWRNQCESWVPMCILLLSQHSPVLQVLPCVPPSDRPTWKISTTTRTVNMNVCDAKMCWIPYWPVHDLSSLASTHLPPLTLLKGILEKYNRMNTYAWLLPKRRGKF